jgi:hypothetical protein
VTDKTGVDEKLDLASHQEDVVVSDKSPQDLECFSRPGP